MAKKQYTDYDNTLFGRYIRQIENPDSAGWDPVTRTWFASTRKGDDRNNRGMGVDVEYNDAAKAKVKGRPKRELSEQEEHQLRNEHIDYLLGVIDRKKKDIPGLANMSPQKQAEVLGVLYRGDAKHLWNKNAPLGKALRSDNEEDFHQAVPLFYNSKNLPERARNNNLFWEQQKESTPTILPVPVQQPATTRSITQSEYQPIVEPLDALQPSSFYRSIVENTQEAPAGPYRERYRLPASQERKNNLKKTFESKIAFDKMMKDVSIQNNPVPEFKPLFDKGGLLEPKNAWDKLSLREKATMMKVAVKNGILDLPTIRQKYNEFAEGGRKREEEEVNTNNFSSGGSIHIKPENRGKFTALKERTGHSATWFKEHGTPAQKKMATFALNARKWKHGLGGNLFDGTTQPSQKMSIGLNVPKIGLDVQGWPDYTTEQIITNGERIRKQREAMEEAVARKFAANDYLTISNDATAIDKGRKQNQHLAERAIKGAKAHRAWEEENPTMSAVGLGLGAVPLVVAATPAILD